MPIQDPKQSKIAEHLRDGPVALPQAQLCLIRFGANHYSEEVLDALSPLKLDAAPDEVLWLNVYGVQQEAWVRALGEHFQLHPLVIDDILNTRQRPKLEEYDDYLFVITRLLQYDPEYDYAMSSRQISIVMFKNVVLTFQEQSSGTFRFVRERLRGARRQIASLGADHLVYALLDGVVDSYFSILEKITDYAEEIESKVLNQAEPALLRKVYRLKHEVQNLRRVLWPTRELMNGLQHLESHLFDAETRLYLRDVYDHSVHLAEMIEMVRDSVTGTLDMYMSRQANRLNYEMRFLTVITTIFMPLSFVAGVYGMNFEYMPELKWHWGYFMVLGFMAVVASLMALVFWRRKWL